MAPGHEIRLLLSISCRRPPRSTSSHVLPPVLESALRTLSLSCGTRPLSSLRPPRPLSSASTCRLSLPPIRQPPSWREDTLPLLRWLGGAQRGIRWWRDDVTIQKETGVLTVFEHLPADYSDTKGLPFGPSDLTLAEVNSIFGAHMGCKEGNKLLRIMHGRRVAGTLDDPVLTRSLATARHKASDIRKALAYLRRTVPVDEVINAGLAAQKELERIARKAHEAEVNAGRAYPIPEPNSVYGKSKLDELRLRIKTNLELQKQHREERRRRDEELAIAEASRRLGVPATSANITTFLGVPVPKNPPSEFVRKWTALATSDIDQPPEMSYWERLGPAAGVVLVVLGLLAALLVVNRPPEQRYRLFPSISPGAATVGALMLLNVAVWVAWKVPPLWWVLNPYFIVCVGIPRAISVLLATFSHQELSHLVRNAAVLVFIGPRLHDDIGRSAFLATYIGSGAVGMLGSLTYSVMRGALTSTTLGMSGSVLGVTAAYFWLHRFDYFKFLGYPPDPYEGLSGLVILALIIGLHLGTLSKMYSLQVDIASHLAGALFGIATVDLAVGLSSQAADSTTTTTPTDEPAPLAVEKSPPVIGGEARDAVETQSTESADSNRKTLDLFTGQRISQSGDES